MSTHRKCRTRSQSCRRGSLPRKSDPSGHHRLGSIASTESDSPGPASRLQSHDRCLNPCDRAAREPERMLNPFHPQLSRSSSHSRFRPRPLAQELFTITLSHPPRDSCVCRPAKYISPYLPHVVQATVNPDIERKHGTQCSENFVRLPSLALLVHNVALQKYTPPHRELRRGTCTKGRLRDVVERDAEAFRHTLEEGAIAGRALRIEAEVRHRPLIQNHDLHIHAAHVADAIGVREEMQPGVVWPPSISACRRAGALTVPAVSVPIACKRGLLGADHKPGRFASGGFM